MYKFQVYILLFTIAIATFVSFRNIPKTFFQQDEWQYFGSTNYSLNSSNPIANIILPLQGKITHFFPLATTMFALEYLLFKLNFPYYAFLNLTIHLANSILLFFLILLITRNKLVAWSSALLFAVNSIAYQPITWVAAGIGTLPGTFFLLLFFISLIQFNLTKRPILLLYSFINITISILFKETAIFVFLFIPLILIIFKFVYNNPLKIPRFWSIAFLTLGFLYVILRIYFLITPVRSSQPEVGDVAAVSASVYVFRSFTIHLKALSQSIVPFPMLRLVSNSFVYVAYPQFKTSDGVANPYIVESILFDLVSFLGSILLLFVSFLAYRVFMKRERILAQTLVASVLFICVSALPYIFIPGKAGFFSIFESRNLYVISIGSTLLVSLIIYAFRKKIIFVLIVLIFFTYHSFSIQKDVGKLVKIGTIRKHFLTTINESYPKLSRDVIFFTRSDKSYYGLAKEDKILPLQSGLGRMLLIWYQDSEHFPNCLYEDIFLHGITEEGFKSCGGRGFGYFRQYTSLISAMQKNSLSPDAVIAYNWDSKSGEFSEITREIRLKLAKDLQYESRQ